MGIVSSKSAHAFDPTPSYKDKSPHVGMQTTIHVRLAVKSLDGDTQHIDCLQYPENYATMLRWALYKTYRVNSHINFVI